MKRAVARAVLCLWACTIALALLVVLRGCAERGPMVTVRVEVPTLEFVER